MKSKRRVFIIGILVITLFLALELKLFTVERDDFGRIQIWYLIEKDRYRLLNKPPKHSLAKFSKIKSGMKIEETLQLLGKATDSEGSGVVWFLYKIDNGWAIKLCLTDQELQIVDYPNDRVFKLKYDEYSTATSYLRGVGTFTGDNSDRPRHSLAKFSKIKIGMNPAETVELVGKPTDSVDSSFIWCRYNIDTGWYIDLHFFNEQLSDMLIVDSPNNRVFELEQDEYITTLPCLSVVAQTDGSSSAGLFTDDRDGKAYRMVKIGMQTWMAENLNFVTDSSVCYNNADSNCTKYGRLYNWNDAMKACPAGWRLSNDEDWLSLALTVAGKCNGRIHWEMAAKKLRSSTGWGDNWSGRTIHNGTDESGFSALPGGHRHSNDGYFSGSGGYGDFWSATKSGTASAGCWTIFRDLRRVNSDKKCLASVRCVRE